MQNLKKSLHQITSHTQQGDGQKTNIYMHASGAVDPLVNDLPILL
jgi:hypothetical protein